MAIEGLQRIRIPLSPALIDGRSWIRFSSSTPRANPKPRHVRRGVATADDPALRPSPRGAWRRTRRFIGGWRRGCGLPSCLPTSTRPCGRARKAQAAALRRMRRETGRQEDAQTVRGPPMIKCRPPSCRQGSLSRGSGRYDRGRRGSHEGHRLRDESAVTGESAPVIRESGGDRSAVTGGTRVLSDWLIVRVTANPGRAFSTA